MTSMHLRPWARAAEVLAFGLLWAGCARPAPSGASGRSDVRSQVAVYRERALQPAGVAPPSVDPAPQEVRTGSLFGRAQPVRAEQAPWNAWLDPGPRLFNDRSALLFEVRITSEAPVAWRPSDTRLELNDEDTVLRAASSSEALLHELLYWAYLEQRSGGDGDLIDRSRLAGPFRLAYVPHHSDDGVLSGLIAFPFTAAAPADTHVVAMRLTVGVTTAAGPEDLVWVFE